MRVNEFMWFAIVVAIALSSVYLMNSEVTGYSVALGFKGTGMAAFKPLNWEVTSEGQFKVSLENLFGERVTIKFIAVSINNTHAAADFNETMAQESVNEFTVNGLQVTENEVYEARIKVYYEDRNGQTLIDQGTLIGVVI